MADNLGYTEGAGKTIAADEVGGVLYQRIKACWGADGAANDTSAANPMPVTAAPAAAIVHGQKNVTTAGTEEALGASTALSAGVRIKAKHANTGWIYVGANPVASNTGYVLSAGEEVFVEVANLATVYIDSSVNGEGVSYIGA